jgi:hypothetical protein
MKNSIVFSAVYLLFGLGVVQAQERIPLPPPEPVPAGTGATPYAPGLPGPSESSLTPVPSAPQPVPYVPSPSTTYPPYPAPPTYVAPPSYVSSAWSGDSTNGPNCWIALEGLLWWVKNQPLSVPIVTTGPASQGANAGGIAVPGSISLVSPLNFGMEGGSRITAGGWFDSALPIGAEGSIFFLQRQSAGFKVIDASGTGQTVINEPVAGAPFSTQVSAPGLETGSVFVNSTSQFGGGDINLMYNLVRADGWKVDLLGGFRYLQLDESLNINAYSTLFTTTTYTDNLGNVLATAPPGSNVTVVDYFGTRNQFYGGQIGARFEHSIGGWFVGGVATLAIGATHEVAMINGSTFVYPVNGPPVALGGGNFANIQSGRYSVNRFAFAPELQTSIGYQLGSHIRMSAGYNFIYLSSVLRPGNQIDNTYDGIVHPIVPMASSSFWAQGLNLSLKFSF